jgi:hypothetical protein
MLEQHFCLVELKPVFEFICFNPFFKISNLSLLPFSFSFVSAHLAACFGPSRLRGPARFHSRAAQLQAAHQRLVAALSASSSCSRCWWDPSVIPSPRLAAVWVSVVISFLRPTLDRTEPELESDRAPASVASPCPGPAQRGCSGPFKGSAASQL